MHMFSEFMAETLARPAASDRRRYLLVDTSATRPANVQRSLGLADASADLLTGQSCNWHESASPVMLELPNTACDEKMISVARSFLETWRFANCFTFIESSLNWSTAQHALRARTTAVLPDHAPVLLRFYDARILPVLLQVLSPEQCHAFLGLACRWAFAGRQGELCLIESDELRHARYSSPLLLTPDQEVALIDAAEIDAMVDLLLNAHNPTLTAALPPEQHQLIKAALSSAKSLNMGSGSDQAAYCALHLELGPEFMAWEPWSGWMPDIKAGKLSFTNAMTLAMETAGHE